jgi:hypothetical protein
MTILTGQGERGYGFYMFGNADMLTARLRESMVVLCHLDPRIPQRRLYQNLHRLGVINDPEILQVEVDAPKKQR